MNKKYYWLKLKEDFFSEKEIKKLRKIAGGDTYTIIYLKMMLLSLRDDGRLYFDGLEESFAEEIALTIDEEVENVKVTMAYLLSTNLMEEVNPTEISLTRIPEMVGSETNKAALMRKSRARKKALEGNNVTEALPPVTKRYPEIEIEKEKEIELEIDTDTDKKQPSAYTPTKPSKPPKHKYGEYKNVLLTDAELEKLYAKYGIEQAIEYIKFLDEYIERKGYKAKSHYLCIGKWVIDAYEEDQRKHKAKQHQGRLDWIDEM